MNFPRPSNAKGQIAGHIMALAKPNKAIQKTEVKPEVKIAITVTIKPKIEEYLSHVCCDTYFGIKKMVMKKFQTKRYHFGLSRLKKNISSQPIEI